VGLQNQETPLLLAVRGRRVEVAKLLVEAKADVNERSKVITGTEQTATMRMSQVATISVVTLA
jgi:ankyrin repeat protein